MDSRKPENPSMGKHDAMDRDAEQWLKANGGVARTSELLAIGVSRQSQHRMVSSGYLLRAHRGVVIDGRMWRDAQPSQRHTLRALAASMIAADGDLALSHHSSLALGGFPLFGVDRRSHAMCIDGSQRHSSRNIAFHRVVDPQWMIPCGQQFRVRDSLAALQVADAFGVEAGLVTADAVARTGADNAEFAEALAAGRFARGLSQPRQVAAMADARMESPGESRLRWLFHRLGMSGAEPQVEFTLPSGRIARADFFFPAHRTVVEFDGLEKYQDREHLIAEKRREDGLRALGFQVVRVEWRDLSRPRSVAKTLEQAFVRSASQVAA